MSDTVKVVLSDDYYQGAGFSDYDPTYHASDYRLHEIPREQRDRWQAAQEAYQQMQAEIDGLTKARSDEMMAERRRNDTTRHVRLRP